MKKQKMLITLAGLVVAVATTATVAAYTLAGDGSSPPANENVGTQEPAFQDDKPTFDPAPNTIDDGKGTVSVTNTKLRGDPEPTLDDPSLHGDPEPTPGDPEPTQSDPENSGVPVVSRPPIIEPLGDPRPLGGGPDIEPGPGIVVGEPSSSQGMLEPIDPDEFAQVLELEKLDLAERLGLADTDPISLVKIGKMEWGNTSLGNPQPGMMYAEVIVPGFKIVLEVDGAHYIYHTSLEEAVFVDDRNVSVSDDEAGEVVAVVPVLNPEEDVEVLE